MKALFRYAICIAAVSWLWVGCSDIAPLQREAGERMAKRMAARFDTPADKPFLLPGGPNAVLFVHGFPGTPAQVRPLAEKLHARGWTVRGLLMPGNGKDVARLSSLTGDEWLNTVRTAVAEMTPHYKRVMVVGYSMGAAMTCASLTPGEVDGLALIAPYTWQESAPETFVWTYLHSLMPKAYQPFRNSNLQDPATRALLIQYFPQEFLDKPEFQEEIRSFTLPIPLIARLRTIVRSAYSPKWDGGHLPTLILQGNEDKVEPPARSRQLARRWGGLTQYKSLPGDHNFIKPTSPSFPDVVGALCSFADEIAAKPPIREVQEGRSRR